MRRGATHLSTAVREPSFVFRTAVNPSLDAAGKTSMFCTLQKTNTLSAIDEERCTGHRDPQRVTAGQQARGARKKLAQWRCVVLKVSARAVLVVAPPPVA